MTRPKDDPARFGDFKALEHPFPDLEDMKMSDALTAKNLAALLTGREYTSEITKEEERAAIEAGLVVVFGASDDLMEFRGAIYDEVGAYEGTTVTVDASGLVPDFENIDKDGRDAKDELRDYFKREGGGLTIEALWCEEGDYSWTFKTDIPHETFEVVEDGAPYCRGIVFALADCIAVKGERNDG